MLLKYEMGAMLLRFVLGATFFLHGLAKFQGGLENTTLYFESVGLPGFSGHVVAWIELVGGVALMVGLATRFVSLLFAIIMIIAIIMVKGTLGYINGFEFDFLLLVISISLMITGSNLFSIDSVLEKSDVN